jgi:SAM-dependent MidA family methyltransferase
MDNNGQTPLIAEIRKIIGEKGKIPFATFMEMALYHPLWGYYRSKDGKWGRRGDYLTSPGVSAVFGHLLAKQADQMWRIMGSPALFSVAEVGSGNGRLSLHFLKKARESYPGFFDALSPAVIELHTEGVDRQAFALEGLEEKISVLPSIEDLPSGMEGLVYSNELPDALPVHWTVFHQGRLREIYVGWENGTFVALPDDPSTEALERHLKEMGIQPVEGQHLMISLAAARWIRKVGERLNRGFVLTIDYGDEALEIHAPGRSDSLLCYYRRTAHGDPFRHVGLQDITSHVDFTALAVSGRKAGLRVAGFTTQYQFLLGLGIDEELLTMDSDGKIDTDRLLWNQAIKELIHPAGMGAIFKVLIQYKGIPPPMPALAGLSFGSVSCLGD